MSFYEVKVVNPAAPHAVIAAFDADTGNGDTRQKATVGLITWALNEPGSTTIRVPLFHAASPLITALTCEIQVWRNGVLIFWGVPVQRTYDESSHSVTWTVPGVLWYWTQRVFGPIATNYLTNPNFATNLTGWTKVGFDPTLFTAAWSSAIRLRGPGTARLFVPTSASATDEADNYLQQTFTVSTGSIGLFIAVAGWYWIDPASPPASPARDERGIYVSAPNSVPAGAVWEPITMSAVVGEPQRVETGIHLAQNLVNEVVTVRLYCPRGAVIHWGACSATALESVSSEPAGTDVTEMMRRIVAYCHVAYAYAIATSTPAAGVTEILAYQFADLGNVFDALSTYPARGLADFEIVLTSATVRTFTTYAPRKGSLKSGSALTVPGSSVVRLAGHQLDGQQTATRVIRRGHGDGSDRELGVAIDMSGLSGLPLDSVEDAPSEVTVDGLDGLAATDLARLKAPVALPEIEVAATGWLGVVLLGDTVPITIDWGVVQDTVTRRVTSMTLDPATDLVKVGVNVL